MARPIRVEFPGALFHVFSRGNAKQTIFYNDDDHERFLAMLGKCAKRYDWIVYAYTLMPNHYHLVIELTTETLSRGMQWLNGSYTQSFNRKHGRVGHVLQGRFKAPLVEKSSYFLELLRYVALNPVRGGLVTGPDEYRWSSHRALLGQVPPPEWLAVDRVLREFGPMRARARGEYERFVNAAIGIESTLWRNLVAQAYLGSDEWLDQVKRKVDEKLRSDDHPWQQRAVRIPTMAAVADVVGKTLNADLHRRGNTMPRSIAAWIASNEALLTNRQIAAGLRLRSAGHVTDLVRYCDRALKLKPGLRECIDRCVSTLRRKTGRPKL